MSLFVRGGRPQHINGATAATLSRWNISVGPTMEFEIHNVGSVEIELFLTQEAADKGAGYGLLIQPGYGYTARIEIIDFWTLSASAGSFRAVAVGRP